MTPEKPFPALVPIVFGMVLFTAIVYGTTGPLVARLLGVRAAELEPIDDDGVPREILRPIVTIPRCGCYLPVRPS